MPNGAPRLFLYQTVADGTTGVKLSPLELLEKLAAIVTPAEFISCATWGCLAPHSQLRGAIIPTPRQQGVGGDEANTGTPRWSWARLLGRVFALDMATRPFCRRGSLRIMATITHEAVITRILRHLNLRPSHLPLLPPVLVRKHSIGSPNAHNVARGLVGDIRAEEVS